MRTIALLTITLLLSLQIYAGENDTVVNEEKAERTIISQTLDIGRIPKISVDLQTPTNLYLLSLPLITIAIVLGGSFVTIRTLNSKTQETMISFKESLKTQRAISENEVRAKVLSASRQQWINTLRDELSEFISLLTQSQTVIDIEGDKPVSTSFGKLLSQLDLKAAKIYLLIKLL